MLYHENVKRIYLFFTVLLLLLQCVDLLQNQDSSEDTIDVVDAIKEENSKLDDGLEYPSNEPRSKRVKRPDLELEAALAEDEKNGLSDEELIDDMFINNEDTTKEDNDQFESEAVVSADGFTDIDSISPSSETNDRLEIDPDELLSNMLPDVATSNVVYGEEGTDDPPDNSMAGPPDDNMADSSDYSIADIPDESMAPPTDDNTAALSDDSIGAPQDSIPGLDDKYDQVRIPPPKVVREDSAGKEQLNQAKRILGLQHGNTEDSYTDRTNYRKAYSLLREAVELGNNEAKVLLASACLQGDHTPYVTHNLTRGYELLESSARTGFPAAQQLLGALYATGLERNSSQSKALLYYTFSALGGDPRAQMSLAYRYWSGVSVAQSCESALKYYTLVADQVARSIDNLGVGPIIVRVRLMDEDNSPKESAMLDDDLIQYYQFLADKGDLQAQLGLGTLHLNGGRGIDRNLKLAHHYFLLAAKAGNTNAYGYLGKIALLGKEYDTALKYFKLSAKDPMGQWGLGTLYYHGWNVKQDYKQAMAYFMGAANEGNAEAELQLAQMYLNGIGVKRDYGSALKHFNMASKQGHVLAFYNLGMMHAKGVGVMRNCQTAAELLKNVAERGAWSSEIMEAHSLFHKGYTDAALVKYLLLAELGYEVAQANAAYILDRENTDFIDNLNYRYKRAFVNWRRSAAQGFGGARLKLGDYYYYGQGTDQDAVEAAEQYELASSMENNPQALFNLGYMHEQGVGKQEDIYLAKRYYDRASEASPDAQIPVFLANTKLQAKIYLQSLRTMYKELTWSKIQDKTYQLVTGTATSVSSTMDYTSSLFTELEAAGGQDWDIYVMSLLAVLLGIVMAIRTHNIRAAQARADANAPLPQQ